MWRAPLCAERCPAHRGGGGGGGGPTLAASCCAQVAPFIRAKIVPALTAQYTFWPLAQLVNFTLIPLDYRIL
jgi:hypothetical protein